MLKRLLIPLVIFTVLGGLLAFDLALRGAAWRLFFELTGEETPIAQFRGLVELGSNLTRPPLNLALDAPVAHASANPYGINTFLEQEVEIAKRARTLAMIREAGFTWIRQQFSWEDIEIHGRGDFTDRRNLDVTGAISAWDKYDNIVSLAEAHDVRIMARLDNPPAWSHADPAIGSFAPPDDLQDYVNFAAAVAARYRGRITHYQVWNEPNIYPEWGEQPVSPEAYTEMLCRTYAALKAVDPQIVVITGALAPTLELSGRDLNDLIFLQRMIDAGAGACFDVLSAQAYGFFSAPTDRRTRPTTITFTRHRYLRDLLVANGLADRAIWLSEAAWNPVDSPDVPADVSAREAYGAVTPEQAAAYMPMGYRLANQDYPYLGVMFYWFFKRAADYERGQSWYYFRMVEPDFTPMPVYAAMRDHIARETPMLYRGTHPPDDWTITVPAAAAILPDDSAPFGYAVRLPTAEPLQVTVYGTDAAITLAGEGAAMIRSGGGGVRIVPLDSSGAGAAVTNPIQIDFGYTAGTHAISISVDPAAPESDVRVLAIRVGDATAANLFRVFAIGIVPLTLVGAAVGVARWQRRRPNGTAS
ncbi:MAG: cellulase family glycosylhydrolase [bacterium]|nr:cellulase family glycosylhydrolase [bacterium]